MKAKKIKVNKTALTIWILALVLLLILSLIIPGREKEETIKEVMKDGVLHEFGRISLFGIKDVNPAYISSSIVVLVLLFFALLVRIFAFPKFKLIPGKFQSLIEMAVGFGSNLAKSNSPHKNGILGAYIFAAAAYIFFGTLFELFGVQAVTVFGASISLPAPLSDINAAIAMGVTSYLFIMSGGISSNGLKGVGLTLKEFSLPISMSFRLFGALLSGLLVTELVYYWITLSFVLPVLVGIMFTLLHALIQTYVLTMLTAVYYGEVSEPQTKKNKKSQPKLQAEN
ncbi:MAG: F0F1 ATP synthase subunit A [Lachnospiraceae bacterium]|nr:F0F1 ATP synthase subunit A [Lachnospiraceae bacterium]